MAIKVSNLMNPANNQPNSVGIGISASCQETINLCGHKSCDRMTQQQGNATAATGECNSCNRWTQQLQQGDAALAAG